MLGWIRLYLLPTALTSASGLFCGSAFDFSNKPESEFVIRFGDVVTSAPFLLSSMVLRDVSPPQVRYVELSQTKRTRELLQLVKTKGLGEDVSVLSIRRNIRKFNFIGEDTLADKVVVHLNVLSLGMEDGVLR